MDRRCCARCRSSAAASGGGGWRWRRTGRWRAGPRSRPRAPPSATCSWSRRRRSERSSQNSRQRRPAVGQEVQQPRQALDVLAVDLDQHEAARLAARSAGAWIALTSELLPMPRAPQSRALLAGRPAREAARVLEQGLGHALDAAQELERHAGDPRHRPQPLAARLPDERVGRSEVELARRRRREPLQRLRRSAQELLASCGSSFRQPTFQPAAAEASSCAARAQAADAAAAAGSPKPGSRGYSPPPTRRPPPPEDRMLISPAYAQAAAPAAGGDMFMSLLPLVLIFVVFYFLLIRPQQKKMKQHRADDREPEEGRPDRHRRRHHRQDHPGRGRATTRSWSRSRPTCRSRWSRHDRGRPADQAACRPRATTTAPHRGRPPATASSASCFGKK